MQRGKVEARGEGAGGRGLGEALACQRGGASLHDEPNIYYLAQM